MLSYLSPLAFSGDGTPVQQLPVSIRHQCMSNWCWASVFELVSALLEDPPRSQCQLATAVDLSGRNCCPCPQMNSPTCNDACDNTHVLENVLGPHSGGTAGQV